MTARLRALARRDPAIAVLAVLSSLATLVAIWRDRFLPLLDWPAHLANLFVWRHLHDPTWGFAPWYRENLAPLPYWAQYAFEYALSVPFGVEAAQKIFLSLALLALPATAAIYARRMGRDPRLGLLASPLAWNFNVAQGFVSYVAALPLLLAALAALDAWAEAPSATRRALLRGGLAALLGVALYFSHILPWGIFLFAGGFAALLAPRPWSVARALAAPLPLLPAAAVGGWCYHAAKGLSSTVNPTSSPFFGVFNDLAGDFATLPAWLIEIVPGDFDAWCLVALAGAWLLLLTGREGAGETQPLDRRRFVLEATLLAVVVLYLRLPRSMVKPFYWYAINRRLAVVVALLAALLPRGPLVGARRWALLAAGLVAVALPVAVGRSFHRFNERARGYEEVMRDVPRGARVLPIMLRLGDPDADVNAFNQWGSYVQMRQGGFMEFGFPTDFPLAAVGHLPTPPWDRPDQFDFAQHGAAWDRFLVHGARPGVDPFRGAATRVTLERRSGEWELWRKRPPP